METRNASFTVMPGQKLDIRCDQGSVTLRDGPTGKTTVIATLHPSDAWDYTALETGGELVIRARLKPEFRRSFRGLAHLFGDSPRAEIEVTAPPDALPVIAVANASVDVEGMRGGLAVRTSNGRVRVSECHGAISVETSNGATRLERLSGAISVHATNGAVTADGLAGSVDIQTSNGRVELDFAPEPGSESSVQTTNGSVTVAVAKPALVDVSVSTVNGRARVELPSTGEAPDRARLKVRTANGSVRVFESVRAVYV